MAANYGLLTESARVPMSGQPFHMGTPVENQAIRYGMEGKKLAVESGQQEFDRSNEDRDIMKSALAVPENDLATPEGVANLLGAVKGRVSPDAYSGLSAHADKVNATHLKNQEYLMKMRGEILDLHAKQMETLSPAIDQGLTEYNKNKAEKGEAYAAEKQREFMGNLFTHTQGMKLPNGQPLYPPELTNSLKDMPPEKMDSVLRGTKYLTEETRRIHVDRQSQDLASKTKEREEAMKGGTEYQDKQGNLWMLTATGVPMRMNPVTQHYEATPGGAFPDVKTLTQIGGKQPAAKAGVPHTFRDSAQGDTYTQNADGTFLKRDAKTGAESTAITLPDGAAKLGAPTKGAQATFTPETAHSIAMSMAMGETKPSRLTPTQNTQLLEAENDIRRMSKLSAVDFANLKTDSKAKRTALRNVENTLNQVAAFDRLVDYNAEQIKILLPKATNTDIPILTKLILSGEGKFTGVGPANAQLGVAIDSLLKEYTKITSGSMGNQVLAEGEINKARQIINSARTPEDLMAVVEYFQKEAKVGRIGGLSAQRDELLSSISAPFKDVKGPDVDHKKIDSKDQTARDSDAHKILRDEYNRELAALKTVTDPEVRQRKMDSIREIRKEAKDKGLALPEPGEATDKPKELTSKSGVKFTVTVK